jgi:hypothetical protein
MTTKVRALILVSLAMVGITVVSITHTQAPRESDQAEVMALNQRLIAAYNSKDVSAIMAFYSDDPLRGTPSPFGSSPQRTPREEAPYIELLNSGPGTRSVQRPKVTPGG